MLTRKAFRVFNTLVVPLDGSELAERALPYAVRLAKEGGRLVLVRAAIGPAGGSEAAQTWSSWQRTGALEFVVRCWAVWRARC